MCVGVAGAHVCASAALTIRQTYAYIAIHAIPLRGGVTATTRERGKLRGDVVTSFVAVLTDERFEQSFHCCINNY